MVGQWGTVVGQWYCDGAVILWWGSGTVMGQWGTVMGQWYCGGAVVL